MKQLLILAFCPLLMGLAQTGDDELVNIKELIPDIVLDIKYNTEDNFVTVFSGSGQKLYTTDECLVAMSTAKRLIIIQDSLREMGLGLKMFDGYRPRAVQYLMWETLPPEYQSFVANPATGSRHNRGAAVDVTLVDLATREELDMGTPFDFFGPEAHIDYTGFPQNILDNRSLLRSMMEQVGGLEIYVVEWWHYEYPPARTYPLLDFQLK
ncbi:MAG: M15 family metallopeptidase [Ignavibacteriales bacterium]|nr:M15 family metallopeptidase [Ignavibacteriales bacterium]